MNLAYRDLYRRKIRQRHEYFFVENPDQKFLLFQNLLGCIHSNSCRHFIWTSSRLDSKTLFVNLHTDNFFSAKFDNDMSTFSEATPDQNSRPHFIWTCPWLDWKTFFVNLSYRDLYRRKIWQRHEYFFIRKARSEIPSVSEPTRMHTLELLSSFHLNKFMTRLKNTFCEPAYRQFF